MQEEKKESDTWLAQLNSGDVLRLLWFVFAAWLIGSLRWSPAWVALLAISWLYGERRVQTVKRLRETEMFIRDMHQGENLTKVCMAQGRHSLPPWVMFPRTQEVKWLSQLVRSLWPAMRQAIQDSIMDALNPIFKAACPSFLASLALTKCDLGEIPLKIRGMRVQGCSEDYIILDMDVCLNGQPHVKVVADTGRGVRVSASLAHLKFAATLRLVLGPYCTEWPCVRALCISFTSRPTLHFKLKAAKVPITSIYGLEEFLLDFIHTSMCQSFVWPFKTVIELAPPSDPEEKKKMMEALKAADPIGLLIVEVMDAKELCVGNLLERLADVPDCYVVAKLGKEVHKTPVVYNSHNPKWNCKLSFTKVYDIKTQVLELEMFDWDRLSAHRSLGRCSLQLNDLIKGEEFWIPLEGVKTGQLKLNFDYKQYQRTGRRSRVPSAAHPAAPASPSAPASPATPLQTPHDLDLNINVCPSPSDLLAPPLNFEKLERSEGPESAAGSQEVARAENGSTSHSSSPSLTAKSFSTSDYTSLVSGGTKASPGARFKVCDSGDQATEPASPSTIAQELEEDAESAKVSQQLQNKDVKAVLIIVVKHVEGGDPKKWRGKQAYVRVKLGDAKQRTYTVTASAPSHYPVWEEQMEFVVFDMEAELEFKVKKDKMGPDQHIGNARLLLSELPQNERITCQLPLHPPREHPSPLKKALTQVSKLSLLRWRRSPKKVASRHDQAGAQMGLALPAAPSGPADDQLSPSDSDELFSTPLELQRGDAGCEQEDPSKVWLNLTPPPDRKTSPAPPYATTATDAVSSDGPRWHQQPLPRLDRANSGIDVAQPTATGRHGKSDRAAMAVTGTPQSHSPMEAAVTEAASPGKAGGNFKQDAVGYLEVALCLRTT
eukprot:g35093.t1